MYIPSLTIPHIRLRMDELALQMQLAYKLGKHDVIKPKLDEYGYLCNWLDPVANERVANA